MLIFREFFNTQSYQNIRQNALNCTKFTKFSREASIMPLNLIVYTSNFQTFLHENYPIANVYLCKKCINKM